MQLDERLLTVNKYSRPGEKADRRTGLVIHWVGVPCQTAEQVRYFFDKVCPKEKHYSSAHYVIDLDGTILQLIPDDEIAWHVASNTVPDSIVKTKGLPNFRMIGIECCVVNDEGEMTKQTFESLGVLASRLCDKHNLLPYASLFRHFDLTTTKKDCHRWFVNNPDKWVSFKHFVWQAVKLMKGDYWI